MDNETYDLVFKAELVAGFDAAQVKKNLQVLFRISEAQVEALFSGNPIPLKKSLDADTANKYRVAMKKAGAKVNVVQSQAVQGHSTPNKSTQSASAQNQSTQNQSATKQASPNPPMQKGGISSAVNSSNAATETAYQTALGAQPLKPAEARAEIKAPDYDVAALGNLLEPSERAKVDGVMVDVSHLSVAEQMGNLVEAHELHHPTPLDIDIPNLDVAPAGSELLKPQERAVVTPVQVDTSALSVSAVGETLGPKKAAPPPAPNVDHIKLAD